MSHREAGHNNSERQRDGEEFLGRESVICSGRDVKSGLSDWGGIGGWTLLALSFAHHLMFILGRERKAARAWMSDNVAV